MKENRIRRFNENSELNISDVSDSFSKKSSMKKFLEEDENRFVWDVAIDFAKWINMENLYMRSENTWNHPYEDHNSTLTSEELFKLFLKNYH